MPRGRGTLTVRKSDNPFYETTNDRYGETVQTPQVGLSTETSTSGKKRSDFTFLYSKTSDVYGEDPFKESPLVDFDYERVSFKGSSPAIHDNQRSVDATTALKLYKHNPVKQNPLYATSASEIGKKPPTEATFVAERAHRSQAFSKSFGHLKPKSSTLNTGLTKSRIHSSLDPQFM